MTGTRIEHDAFGPVTIPANRYWGAQTQRALDVFGNHGERFDPALIHAFGLQKMAAARANQRLGALPEEITQAIEPAARRSAAGGVE